MKTKIFIILSLATVYLLASCNQKKTSCFSCNGTGVCSSCNGSGTSGGGYCTYCDGTGYVTGARCSRCGGTGETRCDVCGGSGQLYNGTSGFTILYKTCTYCGGSGRASCILCGGSGSDRQRCSHCSGGYTSSSCSNCNGTGRCSFCGGSGQTTSSNSGSSDDDSSSTSIHKGDSRYCVYLGKTNGYAELIDGFDKCTIYVYETQPGGTLRASFADPLSDGYIIKSATETVYSGKDPWRLGCNKYIMPLAVHTYFYW